MKLEIINVLFIFSLISIWILLLINILLALNGYIYYLKVLKSDINLIEDSNCPTVSIMIPAHNEEKVIYNTVRSLLLLNYPKDKYEIIVINDNSSDKTKDELERVKNDYDGNNLKVINTDKITGGKGKSNALNIGFNYSNGDYIAIYDADNTAEKNALKYLITRIHYDNSLGAVIGKFRTRNKKSSILTRFINIETLSFQWMSQGGRWNLFNLCTIPGTNFVIRRDIINKLGGWDTKAIAEDTEISFRIYKLGYKIAFMPLAVTWEQEPETVKVWFKQRTRWAKGNIYVISKYMKVLLSEKPSKVTFDIVYFFGVYFFFLFSVIISDILFCLSIFTDIQISVSGNFTLLWILAYILFILEIYVTLAIEKGESTLDNLILVPIMYFTYCQLWLIVAINSLIQFIKDKLFKREVKWYKTERF
ncbi:glycosyltransferase [Clostridium sp.]|uniref:glycosyltransferase n=1 Tax=Clostridium sp. TaxID=1506 RepID=UPI0039964CD5